MKVRIYNEDYEVMTSDFREEGDCNYLEFDFKGGCGRKECRFEEDGVKGGLCRCLTYLPPRYRFAFERYLYERGLNEA